MNNNDLPSKPTARYRSKADQSALSRLMRDAWAAKKNEWDESYKAMISSAATDRLELLFPVEDMLVLQKYGKAKAVTSIGIRIHNYRTDRWDMVYRADLKHPVLATDYAELSALRPQWWSDPLLGIKEEMTEDEWNDVVRRHEESKSSQMPTELDIVFTDWLDMIHEYQSDLKVSDWIGEQKSATGVYPTWGEIVTHYPVLARIEEIEKWAIA